MAKKGNVLECPTCKKKFDSPRGKGNSAQAHYAEFPDHRKSKPATASKRGGKDMTAAQLIQAAVDKLANEIAAKRQMLADVDKIKAEITQLENQRTQLSKMLPPV